MSEREEKGLNVMRMLTNKLNESQIGLNDSLKRILSELEKINDTLEQILSVLQKQEL